MTSTDAITSGARLALVYGLRSDTCPGAEIDRDYHPNSPGMRKLKEVFSEYDTIADMEGVPSMLTYTLEGPYTLDLLGVPCFKGDDAARKTALQTITKGLEFGLYYTVLSYHVVATYEVSEFERPENGEVVTELRALEVFLPLHTSNVCLETECFNENRPESPSPFTLGKEELLQPDPYTTFHYDNARGFKDRTTVFKEMHIATFRHV
jgi:hypothetical protein